MRSHLLDTLDDAEKQEVLAVTRRRRFKRNEVVFHDGDPGDTLHLVVHGHFAIRITTPEGNQAMVRVFGPADFFGELAMLCSGQRRGSAVSLDSGETLSLHREDFEKPPNVEATDQRGVDGRARRRSAPPVFSAD